MRRIIIYSTMLVVILCIVWSIRVTFFKDSNELQCGDLLTMYAQKPEKLRFVKCEKETATSQTIISATYQVSGKNAEEVEVFLIQQYGLGPLKWVCCGWESGGVYGSFQHEDITAIHPNYAVIISMSASGEVFDENNTYIGLEFNRNQIAYFTVTVEIVEV